MRFLALFLLLASSLSAEIGFVTGQGARLVIGQETFTAMEPGVLVGQEVIEDEDGNETTVDVYGPTAKLLGGVGGVAYANDTLFIADSNRLNAWPLNHRVLIYFNVSQKFPGAEDELAQLTRCPVCLGEADVVLGQDEFHQAELRPPGANTLRLPLAVASNGVRLAVADTDNNRILIWNSIPTANGQPADLVLGQQDFDSSVSNGFNPTNNSLKGPQGVTWASDGSLWVADTGNNRVLKWNNPGQNGQPADLVLGAPDFTTFVQSDLTQQDAQSSAERLLTPVSVSTDGLRLYVVDLGYNRVLIWNAIPTSNGAPADIVLGQPDMVSRFSNNSVGVCDEVEQEVEEGEPDPAPLYPRRCAATLSFPRSVISDGQRLFIADGGNDRILVYDEIPTENGAPADHIIGQVNEFASNTSDSAFPLDIASAGVMRTPTSLAWDGRNLYAADPFNRRTLVFTMAERRISNSGVRNAASFEIFATGRLQLSGRLTDEDGNEVAVDDEVSARIQEDDARQYTYVVQEGDTFPDITNGLANAINAGDGDPEVTATPNPAFWTVILTSKIAGTDGNEIKYRGVTNPDRSEVTITSEGGSLRRGGEATEIAPYTIVSIVGEDLADETMAADTSQEELPTELGGVQVYIDGIRSPLYYVSPTQINAQMPVEVSDTLSVSTYVRTVHSDGRVMASNAIAVPIRVSFPGLFAGDGSDPRPAAAVHSSSQSTGVVSINGRVRAGDTVTISIENRKYSYTATEEDENPVECPSNCVEGDENCEPPEICFEKTQAGLKIVQDTLVELINNDPEVEAIPFSQFTGVVLRARVDGPEGNGIRYGTEASTTATGDTGAALDPSIILTRTSPSLCCANVAGAPVTEANPALTGSIISFWATGLGLVDPDEAREAQKTGVKYRGPKINATLEFVSGMVGGKTASVMSCGVEPGTVGIYRCDLRLNNSLPTDSKTAAWIAQGFNVSNIVTLPVFNPNPENVIQ